MKNIFVVFVAFIYSSSVILSQSEEFGWMNSEIFFITTNLYENEEIHYRAESYGVRWTADNTSPPSGFCITQDYNEGWYPNFYSPGLRNVNVNNVNIYFNEVNGFDFVNATPYYNNYILAYGLYKISVIGGSRKGFFYLDYRDANFRTYSVPIGSDIDVWFIYDGIEDRFGFRRYNCGITNNPELFINIENGQILRIWDIKEQNSLFSPNNQLFPAFWSNALILVSDKFNHPKIAWGPYQEIAMSVQNYRIYKKKGTSDFNYLTSTTNLEFVDVNEVIPTQPSSQVSVYYYVRAYGQISESYYESTPSNTVGINVKGGFDKTNNDYYPIVNINNNLNQNYPNPFNPSTMISYSIPQSSFVTLKVYDIIGNEVATLVNETKSAGRYDVNFNASNLSNGVYLYSIKTDNFTSTKKMILMK